MTMRLARCWLVAALAMACSSQHARTPGRAPLDYEGHRGARGLRPENTLLGFAHAIELGVDTLEMDVMLSADDVLVVHHDEHLNPDITRDATGAWLATEGPALRTMTFAELRHYDVGRIRPATKYSERFRQQAGSDGVRIPALAEVVELAERQSGRRIRYNIEIKTTPERPDDTAAPEIVADRLVSIVRASGIAERTTIQSFDWRSLRRVQSIAPEIRRSCLTSASTIQLGVSGPSPWTDGLDVDRFGGSVPRLVHALGCHIWSPDERMLGRAAVDEAHALGLLVLPWTVNTPSAIARLIDWGVDGIITDFPDLFPRRR